MPCFQVLLLTEMIYNKTVIAERLNNQQHTNSVCALQRENMDNAADIGYSTFCAGYTQSWVACRVLGSNAGQAGAVPSVDAEDKWISLPVKTPERVPTEIFQSLPGFSIVSLVQFSINNWFLSAKKRDWHQDRGRVGQYLLPVVTEYCIRTVLIDNMTPS